MPRMYPISQFLATIIGNSHSPPHHPKKSEFARARYDKNHDIALLADLWYGIQRDSMIDKLVDQMPQCIVAVVDNNGSHIKW